jgi:regulator of replication initiation timing
MRLEDLTREELIEVAKNSTPYLVGMQNQIDELSTKMRERDRLVKKSDGFRKTIDLLNAENAALTEANEALRKAIAKLKRQAPKKQPAKKQVLKTEKCLTENGLPSWML